jgi:hypothetical protein
LVNGNNKKKMGQTPTLPCKNIKILLLGHTFSGKTTFTRLLETIYTTKPTEEDLKELWSGCSSFVFFRGIEVLSTLCNELLNMEDLPKDEFDPKILKKMSKIKPDSENIVQLLYDEILSIVEKKTFQNLLETCEDPVGKLFCFFILKLRLLQHFKNYDSSTSFSGFVNLSSMEYITYVAPSSSSTSLVLCTSGVQWTIDDTFGSFYDQKEIYSNHHLITYFISLVNFEKSKKEFQKVLDYSKFDDLPILSTNSIL